MSCKRIVWAVTALSIMAMPAVAAVSYDVNVTPDVIFGTGNSNGLFTVDRSSGVELGLRAKVRFDGTIHSNGDGTYTYSLAELLAPDASQNWNFDWTVNTDWDGSTTDDIDDYTYLLQIDYDPSLGTDFLAFDPITPNTPPANAPFFDHAIGDNATANDGGTEAGDGPTYSALIAANNVCQQSWRHGFFTHPTLTYDATIDGTYDIVLTAYSGATPVASVGIQVIIGAGGDPVTAYVDDDWTSQTDVDTYNPALIWQFDAFATIQEGIDAVAGSTVNVLPGTYAPFVLNSAVNMLGAQAGVDARGRIVGVPDDSVESVITSAGGILCELLNGSGGSVIDGFAFVGGASAIQSNGGPLNNLVIQNNHIEGTTSSAVFLNDSGIDITVHQNVIDGSAAGAGGIMHLDQDSFDGFHFTSNNVLNADTGFFVDGNHNVGVSTLRAPRFEGNLFDGNGAGANFGRFGVEFATVRNNTFSNNTFDGLQGGIQNSVITRNTFSGNDRAGLRLTGFGGTGDATRGAQSNIISNNFFFANGAGASATGHGDILLDDQFDGTQASNDIRNNSLGSTVAVFNKETSGEIVDFSGNWWGHASGPAVPNHPAGTGNSILGAGDGDTDFTPWLDNGTDDDLGTAGFQGDFSTLHVDDDSPQSGSTGRVQEGVDSVTNSTVLVEPGMYEEQVVIDMDNLELIGSGSGTNPLVDSIIQSPVSLTYFFTSGSDDNYPVVAVHDATGVSIESLRVDGLGRGNGNYRFQGISFWNAGGEVTDCAVTGIRETPLSGSQHGVGIYAFNNTGGPYTINVSGTSVDDYQKNGMALSGTGLTANVSDSSATGSGPLGVGLPAQNGIQIGTGAGGTVDGCTISDHMYTPATFAATGLLFIGGPGVNVTNTVLTDNQPGVYCIDTPATFDGLTLSHQAAASGDGFYARSQTPAFNLAESRKKVRLAASPLADTPVIVQTAGSSAMVVSISNSTFDGHDAADSWGVTAFATGTDGVELTVNNSKVRDWDLGIVAYDAGGPADVIANYNQITGNTSYGFYNYFAAVMDAQNNWWGDATGPLDASGADEAETPTCFDASTMSNTNGLGNGVSDLNVDYCPWLLGTGTMTLEVPPGCQSDTQITVELWMRDLAKVATGFQAFVEFNDSVLTYRGDLSSYTLSPFPLHIGLITAAEVASGQLNLNGSDSFGGSGTNADSLLATLVFDVNIDCGPTSVDFQTGGSFDSELSLNGSPLPTGLVGTGNLTLDDTDPVIDVCPTVMSVECDGAGNAADVAAWLATFMASDTCSTPVLTNDYTSLSDGCGATGAATVTFTATDACGNDTTCVSTFTVVDMTDPSIDVAASDMMVECDGAGNTAELNAWLADNGGASASDICGGITWSNDFTALSDDCGATGSATVTFTATDDCGNFSTTMATFTIVDSTDPSIDVAASNMTVECDGAGNTTELNAWLADSGGAVASDVCGGVTWSFGPVVFSDDCGLTGTATVTFTATDDCGNTETTMADFIIEDTTPPVNNDCPADIVVNADAGGCTADVTWTEPTATDLCGGVSTAQTATPGDTFPTGTTEVTYTFTDDCGNPTECSFDVTVLALNDIDVQVELVGVLNDALPLTRCIQFVTDECGTSVDVVLTFEDHDANAGTPPRAIDTIEVPCGDWSQLCAKDEQHTMYETTTLTDAGAYYTADTVLSLRGGDTDNDSDVDINDVTWFVFTFGDLAADGGCPWDGTTRDADFSNNGAVGSEDYSFLTANWLDFTNCSCTLASSPAPGRKPHGMGVTAIDTQLLQPEVAEMVDANRDGRFDHQDVRIFEERHGLPHELSRNLKMLDQSLDDAADVNESNPGRNQAGRN